MQEILSTISTFGLFILTLGVLVFIHELGHYIVARLVGAKVEEFALGLGWKIWGKKIGETEYKINLLPLGGYVKILGENEKEGDNDPRSLKNKTPLQRIAVMIAGVVMNFLLASILYISLFSLSGFKFYLPEANSDFKPLGGKVILEKLDEKVEYSALVTDGNAKKASLPEKGEIKKIGDSNIEYSFEIPKKLGEYKGREVIMNICDSECKDYNVQVSSEGKIGISLVSNYIYAVSYADNKILSGFSHGVNMIRIMFGTLGNIFSEAKQSGDYSTAVNTVSGPVGIYLAIDYVKQFGLTSILGLMADLSLVLAFMNLLPIPALDGGRILLTIPELITRKPINPKLENILINVSFILLMLLMVAIMVKDVVYFESMKEIFK